MAALTKDDYKKIFVDDSHLIDEKHFERITKSAEQTRRPLDQLLMEQAFVAPHQLLQLLGTHFKTPSTALQIPEIDRDALKLIPQQFAANHLVIAFGQDDNTLKVAMVKPDEDSVQNLSSSLGIGKTIEPYAATESSIRRALVLYDGSVKEVLQKVLDNLEREQAGGAVDTQSMQSLVDSIIEVAVLMGASDVHIEPFEHDIILRFRIDGLLRTILTMPSNLLSSLVAKLKISANIRVDQKRLPQDGRFSVDVKGQEVNVRLSTVPSLWGEKAVLRILPKEAHLFDMGNLGLLDHDLNIIKEYLKRPHGLILVCGPTGSGKTTSLYAFLQEISTDRIDIVNISTIEDPIEYTIPRVTQIQTQPEIDLTFANGLRALLRQDPDILMVGEIRDKETASFAVRASLVGRLVFSSLHTNDAVGAIPRLLDMEVEPYLVSSTMILVVAQRLARKLCLYCRTSYKPEPEVIKDLVEHHDLKNSLQVLAKIGIVSNTEPNDLRFFKPTGCEHCGNTGYIGRIGVFEILEINESLRKSINRQDDSEAIVKIAKESGMKTMFQEGLAKVILGTLDLNELLRVVYV